MTLELLAADVIALLDLQVEYFKSRDHNTLIRCKELERAMRRQCQEIVCPPKEKPGTLFDQINEAE